MEKRVSSGLRYALVILLAGIVGTIAISQMTKFAAADSTSVTFESPTYTLGNINGQDGWSKTGPYDVAVIATSSLPAGFGAQSLRVSNAVTSGSFGDQTFSKSLVNEAGEASSTNNGMSGGTRQNHFEAEFSFASASTTQQPGLSMSVSPDRGDGSRMSYLRFVDDVNGIDVYFDDVTSTSSPATFTEVQVANDLSRTSTHTAKFVMDFVNGPSNDVVLIYIDGVLVKTGTSWENYYRFDTEALAEQTPRTADNLLIRVSGTPAPATAGSGFYVDNLSLLSSQVAVAPVTVTIVKYIDGQPASAASTSNALFPVHAVFTGGTSDLNLGPSGLNNPNPYQATSGNLAAGSSYSVNEVTGGSVVGESCTSGQPYALNGYSTGTTLAAAAASSTSSSSPSFTNLQSNMFVVVKNIKCIATSTPTTTPITVTIVKYFNGAPATASSTGSASFPMHAVFPGGEGNFSLGPVGFNNTNPYQATTAVMPAGSNYSISETASTTCNGNNTYMLGGYSTGATLASAAAASTTATSSSSLSNLQSSKFIVVRNISCQPTTTPGTAKVHILKYLDGAIATASSSNNFLFPMSATWAASNLGGGATSSGSYVLGNSHGGASNLYGADTALMNAPYYYTTSEVTSTSTGSVLPIGSDCVAGKYRLVGYSVSATSFTDAQSASTTSAAPVFSGASGDRYVIVRNQSCGATTTPPTNGDITINTWKVMCEKQKYLPDWVRSKNANGRPTMVSSTTAQEYVDLMDGVCWIEDGWSFQWGTSSSPKKKGNFLWGAAGWNNFDTISQANGPATVTIASTTGPIWVREELEYGFRKFTDATKGKKSNSAELFCHKDGLNYDNYDRIDNITAGGTYTCVAFNAPKKHKNYWWDWRNNQNDESSWD